LWATAVTFKQDERGKFRLCGIALPTMLRAVVLICVKQ
jgi:hypothetical protein